jgi:hypothetical protein
MIIAVNDKANTAKKAHMAIMCVIMRLARLRNSSRHL